MKRLSERWYLWGLGGALCSLIWILVGELIRRAFAKTIVAKIVQLATVVFYWPCIVLAGLAAKTLGSYVPVSFAVYVGFPVLGFLYGIVIMFICKAISKRIRR